ncbi:hypothetical protein SAMN04487866_11561 [Thermoactinomyces sp. DSM 45891]|uniref:hypothetical protein n=1 Tax=Thermoactinomyces sp. DSM 45891 TaxID=1761907 RepID=UPI0009153B37|nr:hypothetical protein [Thermoactinomyces sp. DSM 45891]SFX65353.1 hypothetical protein SAMN04487866_11561 [Thermoactinomyces sp. DSM 45891]
MSRILKLSLVIPLLLPLVACGNDLDTAEKTGLDYVIEVHTNSKRDTVRLSQLTGRNKSKEGIAHIKPFLKPTGTVWVGSKPTSDKNKRAVYTYFSTKMTEETLIKGVYVEQRGDKWIYSGDIELEEFPKIEFDKAKEQKQLQKLKVSEWKQIDIK